MHAFEHVDATSAADAVGLLSADPTARAIAGGTDLIAEMRLGIHAPGRLINLKTIAGAREIRVEEGSVKIGALAGLATVANHPLVRSNLPILVEAIELAASPQIRHAATIGGSLCQESRCWYFRGPFHCWLKGGETCYAEHGDNRHQAILGGGPCYTVHPSDPATALVALDARVCILGPGGERVIPLTEFFTRPTDNHRTLTSIQPGEILRSVEVPWPSAVERGVFLKSMDRAEFGFALASVACGVAIQDEHVTRARVVLGGVAPVPWRSTPAEQVLVGSRPAEDVIDRACNAAIEGARPLAMNAYKVPLLQALSRRALRTAFGL